MVTVYTQTEGTHRRTSGGPQLSTTYFEGMLRFSKFIGADAAPDGRATSTSADADVHFQYSVPATAARACCFSATRSFTQRQYTICDIQNRSHQLNKCFQINQANYMKTDTRTCRRRSADTKPENHDNANNINIKHSKNK